MHTKLVIANKEKEHQLFTHTHDNQIFTSRGV
jgi:hypothetical protein